MHIVCNRNRKTNKQKIWKEDGVVWCRKRKKKKRENESKFYKRNVFALVKEPFDNHLFFYFASQCFVFAFGHQDVHPLNKMKMHFHGNYVIIGINNSYFSANKKYIWNNGISFIQDKCSENEKRQQIT